VRAITGGRSNLIFLIAGTSSGDLDLRRPPLGSVLQSAHDVWHQYRSMRALATSDVPVPGVFYLREDAGDRKALLRAAPIVRKCRRASARCTRRQRGTVHR